MGIKGLNKVINKFAKESIITRNISEFKKSTIAIDAEILMYKFRHSATRQQKFDQDKYHIYAIIKNVITFLENDILPVYIFDGIPSDIKIENCLNDRRLKKKKFYDILESLEVKINNILNSFNEGNFEETSTFNKLIEEHTLIKNKIIHVSKIHKEEVIDTLNILGIPCISNTPDFVEAEHLCVYLASEGLVDYVYSDDSDCFAIGASYLKNNDKDITIMRKNGLLFETISVKSVLNNLKLTSEEFIKFCIISGCDYCSYVSKDPIKLYESLDFKLNNEQKIAYKMFTEKLDLLFKPFSMTSLYTKKLKKINYKLSSYYIPVYIKYKQNNYCPFINV